MARTTQKVSYHFAHGQMEGVADELQDKHPSEVKNLVWDKEGRLRSRFAYKTTGGQLQPGAPFDYISDGENSFWWGSSVTTMTNNERNRAPLVQVSREFDMGSGLNSDYCDSSNHSGHLALVYDFTSTGGTAIVETHSLFVDGSAARFVGHATTGARRPKVVHANSGGTAMCFMEDSLLATALNLNRFTTTASSPTFSNPITDYGGNHFALATDDTNAFVAYGSSANRLTVKKVNSSGTVLGTYTHAADDADAVDIYYEPGGDTLYVVYDDTMGAGKVVSVDPATMAQVATNTPFNAGAHDRVTLTRITDASNTTRILAFRCEDTTTLETEVRHLSLDLTTMGNAHTIPRVILQSKAFTYTGNQVASSADAYRALCLVSDANAHPFQPHLVLCEFNELAPSLSNGEHGYAGCVPLSPLAHDAASVDITSGGTNVGMSVVETQDGGEFYVTCLRQTGFGAPAVAGQTQPVWGTRTYKLDFTNNPYPGYALFEGAAHTIGGLPVHPTKSMASESAVVGQPAITSSTLAAGALTGDYSWRCVWELAGPEGVQYRSAPSDDEEQTLTAQQNTLTVTAPRFGWDFTDSVFGSQAYTLAIYRTKAGGSIFFLLDRIKVEPGTAGNASTGLITYIDNKADNILTTGEVLRHGIAGGDLAPIVPPASRHLFPWRDRLCLVSAENPTEVWPTKPSVRKQGPEWNGVLAWRVPDEVVAGVQLNNTAVLFARDKIYASSGSLGDAAGRGQTITTQLINSTLGCISKQSVISGLQGVYFQSKRGLELLKPNFEVSFVGRAVQDTLDGQTIGSSALDPETDSVVWVLHDTSKVLRLNESNGNWCVDEVDSTVGINLRSLRPHRDRLTGACAVTSPQTSQLFEVDSTVRGSDIDGSSVRREYPMSVTTPWFRVGEIQGFQQVDKVSLLGQMALNTGTSRDITIKTYHDYSSTETTTTTFSVTGRTTSLSPFQVQLRPTQQHCQAIRFQFEVDGSQTVSTDWVLTNLELEIGLEPGLARLSASSNK